MATYTVQAPDGKTITLEGPEGASEDEVIAQAQKLYNPADAKGTPKPAEDQSIVNKAASGLREGVYGMAKDAGNWVKENPQTAFDLGTLGLGAYGASKIPGVRPLVSGGLKNMGGMAADLSRLSIAKAGQVAGDIGQSAKYYGDVAKQGMSDISRSQVKYPNVGKALGSPSEVMKATGKAGSELMSKYGPMAAKLGIPLELLTYSGALNTNEEEELAKRRKQGVTLTKP